MRSRQLIAILVCGTLAAVASAVNLTITVGGQKFGTGSVDMKALPNGNLSFTIAMNIDVNGIKSSFKAVEVSKADGMPVTSTETRDEMQGKVEEVKTYGPTSVTVKTTTGGKTTSKTYPYPKTGTVKSPSNSWFLVFKPKVGTSYTSWSLNDDTHQWEKETTTYTGDQNITVGGKSIKAHLITHTKGKLYVDEKGIPYRIEMNQSGMTIVLER